MQDFHQVDQGRGKKAKGRDGVIFEKGEGDEVCSSFEVKIVKEI